MKRFQFSRQHWLCLQETPHLLVIIFDARDFPGDTSGKESNYAGAVIDMGLISGLGQSPGGVHDDPLQYSCWRIPWTEEPGELQSIGSQRVGHE